MRNPARHQILRRPLLLILTFLFISLPSSYSDKSQTSSSSSSSSSPTPTTAQPATGVIELDARNFDSSIRDGNVWLIEFYAPWCSHCRNFASTYEKVATTLQADHMKENNKRKIMVGKVDGSNERALSSRFSIRGFPSFFLVEGWTVRQYGGLRSLDALVKFANETYVDVEPIPFLNSPFGPVGQSRAILMYVGTKLIDVHGWLVEKGFSAVLAAGIMSFCGVVTSLGLIIFIGLMVAPKPKVD